MHLATSDMQSSSAALVSNFTSYTMFFYVSLWETSSWITSSILRDGRHSVLIAKPIRKYHNRTLFSEEFQRHVD